MTVLISLPVVGRVILDVTHPTEADLAGCMLLHDPRFRVMSLTDFFGFHTYWFLVPLDYLIIQIPGQARLDRVRGQKAFWDEEKARQAIEDAENALTRKPVFSETVPDGSGW